MKKDSRVFMRVGAVKFNQLYNRRFSKENINFKGVDYSGYNSRPSSNDDINLTKEDEDITQRFTDALNKIRDSYTSKREAVWGLFKKRQLRNITKEEDDKISGFIIAQNIKVEEQENIVKLMQNNLELLRKNNATQEELQNAQNALIIAQKSAKIAKEMAINKDSHVGFDAIAGYDKEKFILTEQFISPVNYEKSGLIQNIPNGILFFGPFGNGKTSFAKALAQSAGCDFKEAKTDKRIRDKNLRIQSLYDNLIKLAKDSQENFINNNQRTIILIDEISEVVGEGSIIEPKLKRFLDNCSNEYHCTIFATTNNPLLLSSAMRNSKRMPIKVALDPPDEINTALILKHYLKDFKELNLDNIDIEYLAEKICSVQPYQAYTCSQIEAIVKECIEENTNPTQKDLERQIDITKPGLDSSDLDKYNTEKREIIGGQDE